MELIIWIFNFMFLRDIYFSPLERSLKAAQTDWDSYYARPYRTASLTRKHTASVLVDLMRRNNGAQASILEFGGANSCFIDQILAEVAPVRYDVIDSNQMGLALLYSGAAIPATNVSRSAWLTSSKCRSPTASTISCSAWG